MKLATGNSNETAIEKLEIHLPFGLVGLAGLKKFKVMPIEGSSPFMVMRANNEDRFDFIVIEPCGVVPNYALELTDNDAEELQISGADDAIVLNIITVHSMEPQYVTVNLVGPVVINRRTLIGKQVIAANADLYSTQAVLIDERAGTVGGASC